MGTLGFGVLGAGVGTFFGSPALGFTFGTAVGRFLFGRSGNQPEPPRLEDKTVQSSALGAPIPRGWGTFQYAGEIIWSLDIKETELEENAKGNNTIKTYSYSATFATAFCRGPVNGNGIAGIWRIWADAKLIYDFSNIATPTDLYAANEQASGINIYYGTQDQEPSALQEADRGAGEVPAYRGTVYIEFVDMNIDEFGARIPSIRAEVVFSNSTDKFTVDPAWTDRPTTANVFFWENGGVLEYRETIAGSGGTATKNRESWTIDGRLIDSRNVTYTAPNGGNITAQPVRGTGIDGLEVAIGNANNASATPVTCWYQDRAALPDAGASPGAGQLFDDFLVALPLVQWDKTWYDANREIIFVGTSSSSDARVLIFDVTQVSNGLVLTQTARSSYTPAAGNYCTDTHATPFGVFVLEAGTAPKIVEIDPSQAPATVLRTWTGVSGTTGLTTLLVDEAVRPLRASICIGNGTGYRVYDLPEAGGAATQIGIGDVTDPQPTGPVMEPGRVDPNLTLHRGQFVTPRLLTQGDAQLQEIITDVCALTGIPTADLDVTSVTNSLRGYSISRETTGRQALEQLLVAYQVDSTESDGKLKFQTRDTGAVVATIPEEDLGVNLVGENEEMPGQISDQITQERRQDNELPRSMTVRYRNPDRNFESGAQTFRVQAAGSQNESVLELAAAITDEEAAAIAERIAVNAWIERDQFSVTLGAKWLKLDATDAVEIRGRRMRIVEIASDWDALVFRLALVADSIAAMTAVNPGISDPDPPLPNVPIAGLTLVALLDIPLLRDADIGTESGWYFGLSGAFDTWPGGGLLRSRDSGTTWQQIGTSTRNAQSGYATTVLADGPSGFDWNQADWTGIANQPWDATNTVTVRVSSIGTLENASQAEILAGANTAILGNEVIGWQTAGDNGDGTWTLSGLLRGRRGTQEDRLTHAVEERFVVLSALVTGRVGDAADDLGQAYLYRAPTLGQDLTTAAQQSFTNTGIGLRPFTVVNLTATRPPVGTGWTVTLAWSRRSRYGNEYRDFGTDPPPLDAPDERFDVEIWDSAGTAFKRLETVVDAKTIDYTEAKQNTDFGDAGQPFQARVYQVNTNYPGSNGRGPAQVLQFAGFADGGTKDPTKEPIPNVGGSFLAGEALTAGQFVNVYDDNGARLRAAKSDTAIRAHGYVLETVAAGEAATLYVSDINTGVAVSVGVEYYLSSAGGITTTRPSTAGHIVQRLGVGTSTGLLVDIGSATEVI